MAAFMSKAWLDADFSDCIVSLKLSPAKAPAAAAAAAKEVPSTAASQ